MASYFESKNLKSFAHWMQEQAKEEIEHAMKLYSYLVSRGGRVLLSEIETPPSEWESPLRAFEDAYQHERKVTRMIDELIRVAKEEDDNATEVFLQWFVNEQVEEEASTNEIVEKLRLIGDAGGGLLMLDRQLGER